MLNATVVQFFLPPVNKAKIIDPLSISEKAGPDNSSNKAAAAETLVSGGQQPTPKPTMVPDAGPRKDPLSMLKASDPKEAVAKTTENATGKNSPVDINPETQDSQKIPGEKKDAIQAQISTDVTQLIDITDSTKRPDATNFKPTASLQVAPNTDGISAAKLDLTMKKTDKANKIAGPVEKILPENVDSPVSENNLPAPDSLTRSALRSNPGLVMQGSSSQSNDATGTAAVTGAATAAVFDVRTRALERTHDIIALHAMRMGDSKIDSLHVVIKPGAGLQLSLEMRQRNGGIEAQMTLQRGDFSHFNRHWPELQQRLEQRGIRMAPLATDSNAAAGSGTDHFRKSQREFSETDPLPAGALPYFALASSIAHSGKPGTATAHRGWETWA